MSEFADLKTKEEKDLSGYFSEEQNIRSATLFNECGTNNFNEGRNVRSCHCFTLAALASGH